LKPKFKIADREIGAHHPPLIVAELGINHGGNLETAKAMVRLAHLSGAECIKTQMHIADDEMTQEARAIIPPNANQSIWEIIETNSLSIDEELELKLYTESLGLIYLSTPFSRSAASFLNEINVDAFKIGSGEADNLPLIDHISGFGKPVILSTGMQTVTSLEPSIALLREKKIPFALLQCTNLYPSPPETVALRGMDALRESFSDAVIGFSDHSIGPYMAIAAVARGASIVERHFTDSHYRTGPDISASMDPAELRLLVDQAKNIHLALQNSKGRTEAEEAVYRFARGSIVADRDIEAGTLLTNDHVWARRPGTGEIPASEYFEVLGRRAARDLSKNQQLKRSDLI